MLKALFRRRIRLLTALIEDPKTDGRPPGFCLWGAVRTHSIATLGTRAIGSFAGPALAGEQPGPMLHKMGAR